MAVAAATRFKVNSIRHLPRFFQGSFVAARQARRSPGFRAGRLRIDSGGALWTLTLWQSGRDMVAFRDSGAHAVLSPKLAGWASEAVAGVWTADGGALPSWDEVNRRVADHPNFTPIDDPGPAQLARYFDPTRRGLVMPIPRVRRAAASQENA